MSAEEKVIIKVEIDADINDDMLKIERRLQSLQRHSRSLEKENSRLDKTTDRLGKRFGKFNATLGGITGALGKFVLTLGKISFIAVTAQAALFTVGLVAVKAALITGRFAVRAYQASLAGLSIAAAGVATAVATAVAAMRQFNEVQLSPYFGGGKSGATTAARFRRQLATSPIAGLLGGEATAAITASLARAGVPINTQSRVASQIFNLAGGDTTEATRIANALGTGKFDAASTAIQTGPGFRKDSLKGVSDTAGLLSAITSGAVVAENFKSLAEDMGMTFVGTIKTEFVGFKELLGDIGEPLLEPFRVAFQQVSRIIKDDFIAMSGIVQKFGAESFAPTIVTVVDKVSEFFRSNIMSHLDRIEEIGENFMKFFHSMGSWLRSVGNWFKALEPAADVVVNMFKAMGGAAGGRSLFQSFQQLVLDNADAFIALGDSLGNVFGALFDLLAMGQGGFFNKLPNIADSFNVIASSVIPALGSIAAALMPIFEKLPTILESVASLLESMAPIVETLASAIAGLMGILGGSGGLLGVAALGLGTKGGRRLMGGAFRGANFKEGTGVGGIGALGAVMGVSGLVGSYQQGGSTGTALMSTVGGAMTGAAIGSVIPGVGTAVGAVTGAIFGGIASYVTGRAGRDAIQRSVKGALGSAITGIQELGAKDLRSISGMSSKESFLSELKMSGDVLKEGLETATFYRDTRGPADLDELTELVKQTLIAGAPGDGTGIPESSAAGIAEGLLAGRVNQDFQALLDEDAARSDSWGFQASIDNFMNTTKDAGDVMDAWREGNEENFIATMDILSAKTGKTVDEIKKLDPQDLLGYIEQFQTELTGAMGELQPVFDRMTSNMDILTTTFGMTEEAVDSLLAEFKLNLDEINAIGFGNFIRQLQQAQQILSFDRDQLFVPSTLETPAGQAAAQETAKGTRDELFAAAGAGNYDPAMLQRFLDSQTVFEIASGTDPYLAYASAITSLMGQTRTDHAGGMGVNADEFSQMFDLPGLLEASYKMIEESLGVAIPTLFRESSPASVEGWVSRQQAGAQAFTDVAAGDTRGLSNLDQVTQDRFVEFLSAQNDGNLKLDELKTSGDTQNEELKTAWAQFNSSVLDIDNVRNNLLTEILTAVNKPVQVSVSGDTSETSADNVTLSISVLRKE